MVLCVVFCLGHSLAVCPESGPRPTGGGGGAGAGAAAALGGGPRPWAAGRGPTATPDGGPGLADGAAELAADDIAVKSDTPECDTGQQAVQLIWPRRL